jgi:hypothetical protein
LSSGTDNISNKKNNSEKTIFLINTGSETGVFDPKNISNNKAESEKINFISKENSEIKELESANKFSKKLNSNFNCLKKIYGLSPNFLNELINSNLANSIKTNLLNNLMDNLKNVNFKNNHNVNKNNNNNYNLTNASVTNRLLSQIDSLRNVSIHNSNINNYYNNINNFNNNYNLSAPEENKNFIHKPNNLENQSDIFGTKRYYCNDNSYAIIESILQKHNLFIEKFKAENDSYLSYLISYLISAESF